MTGATFDTPPGIQLTGNVHRYPTGASCMHCGQEFPLDTDSATWALALTRHSETHTNPWGTQPARNLSAPHPAIRVTDNHNKKSAADDDYAATCAVCGWHQTGLTRKTLADDGTRHARNNHPNYGRGPTIGDQVHYLSYGTPGGEYTPQCRVATITEVSPYPDTEGARTNIAVPVGLCVINPTGLFFRSIADGGSMQSELGREGGTWHWPCDGAW